MKAKNILLIILLAILLFAATYFFSYRREIKAPAKPPISSLPTQNASPAAKKIYLSIDLDMSKKMLAEYQSGQVKLWYDPKIFTYLQDNQIPTAFFVSGMFAETYPDLLKTLAKNPLFSIQNHSYDETAFTKHCYWLNTLETDQDKINQINKTQKILTDLSGQEPKYFRFPGLCHTDKDDQLVQNLGYQINEGDIIASDPFNFDTKKITNNVLSNLHNNGTIIMHIGGPNAPKSFDVLKIIAPKILEQGYIFAKW